MEKIEVLPHDEKWELEFLKAKNYYLKLLKTVDVEVIHVGSTSVKGLWAKPILDIDIVVNNLKDSLLVINALKKWDINTLVI